MTAVVGGDAWRITGEDRAKHDAQFFSLKPVNGFISGEQARGFFMQSGLPTAILGQIWSLADMNNDGKMDKKEFSIAMHLIKKKLQGYELPKSLPQSLKADPSPVIGSFGTMPQPTGMVPMGPQMGMPTMGMVAPVPMSVGAPVPMMSNGIPPMVPTTGYMGPPVSTAPGGFPVQVPGKQGTGPTPAAGAATFAMPHNSKLKYTQLFNTNDRNKKGTLTGVEARAILVQTGVPQQTLAQIWNLSDYDKDGKLSCDEFCIAMHLIDLVKMGIVLPVKLPAELVPGKARSGSFGTTVTPPPTVPGPQKESFGDLLGSMGMPPPVQPAPATNGEPEMADEKGPYTFEDKRKENFDKGQAELERRRQMLQEQMRREEEARQEKERKEHEKRERQRQEQEMKKQQELERQMEKQRQIEKQKEEQRQKMMEQRESARRELERQRQMEWERQRKEQLMAEKAREYEQLMALKSQTSNYTCELESLQGKKTEISTKISQVKNGVTDFTAHIEAMRSTRDLKLADIERLQNELQELSLKLQSVQSQRQDLDLKVQTSVQNTPMSETHRTMMHSVELKRTSVQRLKKDLEEMEKQTEIKLVEIDQANTEIKESESKIQNLQSDIRKAEQQQKLDNKQQAEETERVKREKDKHEKLRKELEAQRHREEEEKKKKEASKASTDTSLGGNWFDFGGDTKTSNASDNWASVFDTQPKTTAQSTSIWDSLSSQTTTATTVSATGQDEKKIRLSGPTQKYKALYQFDARNVDELSLQPGDIVMVYDNQTGAEPGWKGGEMNGKSGWFPEAYVEKVQESSQTVFGADLSSSTNAITTSEESSFMAVPGKMPSVSPTPGQGKTAPEGLQAQALYPWKAKKENHLTFNKGDIISVREQQDMWWSGELNGKIGWFPKSYVKLISGPTASSASSSAPNSATNSASATPTSSLSRDSPSIEKKDSDLYVAVYAYQSDVAGDLTFNQGEIIAVSKTEGDWWTGSIGDKTGIFPANYVKKSETQAPPKQQQGGTLKKPEIATVIASYTATGPEQLSLSPGQLIQVRKKSNSGWWEGELQARGQKRKIGWFPANYVKLLQGSARATPDNTLSGGARGVSPAPGTVQDNRSANPSPAPQSITQTSATPQPAAQTPPPKYVDHVIAIYPYTAQHGDELTFLKDAVINVIKKEGTEWWQGECNGQIGMFPANYVTSTSPESTSWSTDPAVLAVTSSEEGKRQSYIHELINTEETYMADMSVVMDAFYKPFQLSGVVTEEQLQAIFVNWQELIICNTKFLKALRVRKKMCGKGQVINMIGDMLCENIPHFKPYIRFCSCQLNAAALLQRLTENSSQFREIHKKCVQNTKTKGMPLSSFLLKPMQRITKYPLIVEKILKYTSESHPDHQQLVDALEHCQELCSQVNEGVREKENSDRLEWIQQHVQCDGLPEKITFNSVTNCLGPRKILHNGVLCKAKSNKELGAFLFNDFLLFTTSNRPLNSTHSLFDVTGHVQYKMYKTPVFLNEILVKKPTDEESDVFHLSHIDRVYNLRCHSQNDRDTWVRKLETASRQYLDTERKKRDKAMSTSKGIHHVGRLLVIILEGNNLVCSKDGKSDPYCEVSMGSQEHKTKVINNTLNPKWNTSMQFSIHNVDTDTLCITVFDRDLFSPNDFLGRTEIQIKQILREAGEGGRRPITKHLLLHEVGTGEIVVKLDLHLFDQT